MENLTHTVASPVNPHELVRLLTDLHVGVRKYSMYSGSHAIIPRLVASLTSTFHAVLGSHDRLQIGVTKDEILYQGAPIATGNPVVRELARLLNQMNVAGVTFRSALTEDDVREFLRVMAECRGLASPEEQDQSIERLGRNASSITFQFISFRGTVRDRDASSDGGGETESTQLWRGLVNRLMADGTEESRAALESDEADGFDVERLAAAINQLGLQRKTADESYERTIVSYLHEKATATASTEQRAQMNQQLRRLFTNLGPEVRQRLFNVSLDPAGQDTTPAEALADALPTPMLVEILEQLQVSNRNVSLPAFSLLKKFSTLAESDQTLAESLQSKLGDRQDLVQELLTKRAERAFYPEQYRALLDEEFAQESLSEAAGPMSSAAEFEDAQVDRHLASILLEMLEGPVRSTDQYSQTVAGLRDLIARGLGDDTSTVFSDAVAILAKRYTSATDYQRPFFHECVSTFLQPAVAHHLFGAVEATQEEKEQRDTLAQLLAIVGADLIPLLLDRLEIEQNLKARKRLLALLRDCGTAVVPPAIERLRHPQWYVVRNMLVLIRDLVAVEAVPEVTQCLRHQSSKVRLAAFQALSTLAPQSDAFVQALTRALDDHDPKVFRAALTHLVSSPDHASLELAGRLLSADASRRQRERQIAVLRIMEQAGTSAMVPVLNALMRYHLIRFWSWRKSRGVRSAAARALDAIRRREDGRSRGDARAPLPAEIHDIPEETDFETTPDEPHEESQAEDTHVGPQ